MTQNQYAIVKSNWPRRFNVSHIKPYSFSNRALNELMREDYPDNVIVRMYFGKVCNGTITEQQFRDRLSELWGANSDYPIIVANATGDRSKVSYIMNIPPNGLIHIPETWPELPRCAADGSQQCSAFMQCRVNSVSGSLSGINRQLGTGLPPEPIPECTGGRRYDELTKQCQCGDGSKWDSEKNQCVTDPLTTTPEKKEEPKKEFPWPWVILGGIILTGGILSVAAYNSRSKSDESELSSEDSDKLAVTSY